MTHSPLVAAVLLSLSVFAAAQNDASDESEMSRVRRDQGRIAQRLQSLQEKMDRLAERYDAEGRERNAQLLRSALERLESEGLLERSRAVEQSLDAGLLATVEQQDELSSSLEAIYALLRDRTDTQELAERVDLIKQSISELGFLAEDELGLLQRTRGASDSPAELLDEALSVGAELQQNLSTSQASTAELEDALRGLGESRQAAALAEAQRALAERASDPGADAVQRELSAALDGLRESLAQASPQSGDGELAEALAAAREEARALADRAAEAMRRAEERLADESASGESAESAADNDGAASAESDASSSNEGGTNEGAANESGMSSESGAPESSTGSGEASEGEPSDEAASESGASSASEASASSGATESGSESEPAGGETGDSGSTGSEPTDSAPTGSEASDGEAAGNDTNDGETAGSEPTTGEASDAENENAESSAEAAMQEAAESLEQVAALLGESERALALQRNRARSQGLTASRQANASAEQLEQLMERLEAAEPDEGPELLDRTRDLLAEVNAANDELEQGQSGAAAASQAQAANDLAALMQALQSRRNGASESPPQPVDQAGREQLAAEQADVQRRLRELMDRLSELPDQSFRESAERASEAMSQAEQNLDQGQLDEAALRQQEAAEELKDAQEKLAQEEKRYDQLRQDEVLFRLGEELQSLLERQQSVSAETGDIDDLFMEAGRLGRSQRRALARLGGEQRDLAVACAGVAEALTNDGAVAFVFALERIVDDMNIVADRLEDESTDGLVRALQDGIERRLLDLLDVLEQERERRREQTEESDEPPPDQQQPPSPLVPPLAELLLLQRLELMALDRVERFAELFPEAAEGAELGPIEARELERWAIEHVRVTQLFESLIPAPPAQPDEGFQGLPPLPPNPLEPEEESP